MGPEVSSEGEAPEFVLEGRTGAEQTRKRFVGFQLCSLGFCLIKIFYIGCFSVQRGFLIPLVLDVAAWPLKILHPSPD